MVKLRYVEDVFGFYVYYLWWFMYGKYLIFWLSVSYVFVWNLYEKYFLNGKGVEIFSWNGKFEEKLKKCVF